MHEEASKQGFSTDNLAERYRYFSARFGKDVKADPLGYLGRVMKATLASLDFMRSNDPAVRVLLALTVLGSGLLGALYWRAPQPLVLAAGLLFFLINEDDPWPAWTTTLPVLALLAQRWRGRRLMALGVVLTTVIACMALCGLAGNVASRHFWSVADWALVLLWLIGLASLLRLVFAMLAKVPLLNFGMSPSTKASGSANGSARSFALPALGLTIVSLIALLAIIIRHMQGPHPHFNAADFAAVQNDKQARVVWFDDFSLELGEWEHVPHWLPYYAPAAEPRWIARPRVIMPDGALGGRVVIDALQSDFATAPRWQAMRCSGTTRQLRDPISGNLINVFRVSAMKPAP
jgi:hypothetical protein